MATHQRNDSTLLVENDEVLDVDELRAVEEGGGAVDVADHDDDGGDVKVFARFRPLNERETNLDQNPSAVYRYLHEGDARTIELLRPPSSSVASAEKEFTFDAIFPESTTQEELYHKTARPLVSQLMKGFNCTLMAYGQTGSGKSYSMTGQLDDDQRQGLIPRLIQDLFAEAEARAEQAAFTIQCSYVELYLERIRDLLNPELDNLKLREVVSRQFNPSKKLKSVKSMVFVEGCTVCTVKSLKDMLKVMRRGDANRATAATNMNEHSSRSHAVFVVSLTQTEHVKQTRRSSKLFLVDLAGSESVRRTGATGLTLEQGKKINKSLSALSLVIQSLVEKKGSHIPYRDSKLTRLLTDSLGGNAKTVLLLALSPSLDSLTETYSTLSFGARAKKMENKATVNEELTLGTYKKLVSVMGKDLDTWKRKCEEWEGKYHALLVRYGELEHGPSALTEPVVVPEEEKESEGGANVAATTITTTTVEDAVDVTTSEAVLHRSGSMASSTASALSLDELCLFQTGNLVVFGADKMFTFEPF